MANDPRQKRELPVTVLSGFLGAGKTTLLNHLLRHAAGERIAVIVNDIGETNIDAALVQSEIRQLDGETYGEVIELTGGCICCSIQGDLALAVADLAQREDIDHLIVESTGVAEPTQIVQTFFLPGPNGQSLDGKARIDSLITVIDAAFLLKEWQAVARQKQGRALLRQDDERPVFELMIEQIECADVLVLNKIDQVDGEQHAELRIILDELNRRATKLSCQEGALEKETILRNGKFDVRATVAGASWLESLGKDDLHRPPLGQSTSGDAQTDRTALIPAATPPSSIIQPSFDKALDPIAKAKKGLVTLVYRSRQPFDPDRFAAVINHTHPGLLRAKGYCWIKGREDTVGFLSIAGSTSRCDFIGSWWVTALEKGKIDRSQIPPEVERKWEHPHGDRRQEIVFIGFQLDRDQLQAQLDSCIA